MEIIGASYLVGYAAIAQLQRGCDTIAISDLFNLGQIMQDTFNGYNLDVLVSRSNFLEVAYEFDSYFEVISINNENYIKCRRGTTISGLKRRFQGYHSLSVGIILKEVSENYNYRRI